MKREMNKRKAKREMIRIRAKDERRMMTMCLNCWQVMSASLATMNSRVSLYSRCSRFKTSGDSSETARRKRNHLMEKANLRKEGHMMMRRKT